MKMLSSKLKNSALLFSLAALTACGNLSANVSADSSNLTLQQQQEVQAQRDLDGSILRYPLHDLGENGTEYVIEENESDVKAGNSAATEGDAKPETPKPTVPPKATPVAPAPSAPAPAPAPVKPATPAAPEHKVSEVGKIKPTVYYFPVYNEDKTLCDKDDVKTLHGLNGEKLINVCPSTLTSCGIQGSCAIIQKGVRRSFNISDRINGQDRFFEMTNGDCRFGYGVRSSCLDPFYTVAADLDIYNPGDVIYIPAVVGLQLPDGTTHNGYFIVRDQGRGITGKGRFDFYSGFLSWKDSQNPFRKLQFEDTKTQVPYAKIVGAKADQVLKSRAYPKLPPSSQK